MTDYGAPVLRPCKGARLYSGYADLPGAVQNDGISIQRLTHEPGVPHRFPELFQIDDRTLGVMYQRLPKRFRHEEEQYHVRISEDLGATWQEPKLVENVPPAGGMVGDFMRIQKSPVDGSTWMLGELRTADNDCSTSPAFYLAMESPTRWRGPHLLGFPSSKISTIKKLADGGYGILSVMEDRVFVGESASRDGRRPGNSYSLLESRNELLFYASADGKKWEQRSALWSGSYFPHVVVEPDWVVYRDGRIRVYAREDNGFLGGLLFESTDHGHTWQVGTAPVSGQHLSAGLVNDQEELLIVFRAGNYMWFPAVCLYLEHDGVGYVTEIQRGVRVTRYHADVGSWLRIGNDVLVAYSINTQESDEVDVHVARIDLTKIV